jgi:hypothetical protein
VPSFELGEAFRVPPAALSRPATVATMRHTNADGKVFRPFMALLLPQRYVVFPR